MSEGLREFVERVAQYLNERRGRHWLTLSANRTAVVMGEHYSVQLALRGRAVVSTISLHHSGATWQGPRLRLDDQPASAASSIARMSSGPVLRFHALCERVSILLGPRWRGVGTDFNTYRFSHPERAPFAAHGYLDARTMLFEGEYPRAFDRLPMRPNSQELEPVLRASLDAPAFEVSSRLRTYFLPELQRAQVQCARRARRAPARSRRQNDNVIQFPTAPQ